MVMPRWLGPLGLTLAVLGIVLEITSSLPFFLFPSVSDIPRVFLKFWETARLLNPVLCLAGLALYAKARQESLAWCLAALTLLLPPIGLGPIHWVVAISGPIAALLVLAPALRTRLGTLGIRLQTQPQPDTTTVSGDQSSLSQSSVRELAVPNDIASSSSQSFLGRVLRVLGLLLLGIFPVFDLARGIDLLAAWQEIQKGQQFYVDLPFEGLGIVRVTVGIFGLVALVYLAFRKRQNARGTGFAVVALIAAVVGPLIPYPTTPDYDMPIHAWRGVERVMNQTRDNFLNAGHLPANDAELQMAVKGIWPTGPSWYARAGKRLPYQIVLVPGASGPHLQESAGLAPAIVYCAISPDLRHFWLTGTALRPNQRTGATASFFSHAPPPQGQPLVLEGTL